MARIKQILNERRVAYGSAIELRKSQKQSTPEKPLELKTERLTSVTRGRKIRRQSQQVNSTSTTTAKAEVLEAVPATQ